MSGNKNYKLIPEGLLLQHLLAFSAELSQPFIHLPQMDSGKASLGASMPLYFLILSGPSPAVSALFGLLRLADRKNKIILRLHSLLSVGEIAKTHIEFTAI
jgi:hypothetical protein